MRRILTLLFIAVICSQTLQAVPAYPHRKTIRLQDGTLVTATLRGDERVHYYELQDGRKAVTDAQGQGYRLISDAELRQRCTQERELTSRVRRAPRHGVQERRSYIGKKKGLVILVNFTDVKMSATADPQATFNQIFNAAEYHDYGMSGSVHEYFYDQSYGKFDLEFDVVGPVNISHDMAYYGKNNESGSDSRPGAMIAEACRLADSQVDFNDYDWDGDGEVDQVFVIYAGYGANYGADENCIWPHEWKLTYSGQGSLILDNARIDTYACSCELMGTSGKTIDGIGAACHEFSHCLGIMDHYDTGDEGNFGMGDWDLMCSGSYNNQSRTPAAYTSYERWFAGWLEPVEINSPLLVTDMKPLEDAPEAYVLYNDKTKDEYYLLENRQLKGWDQAQSGHGLLVVHVDYDEGIWHYNSINNEADHQRMTIVPADGSWSRHSLSGDPFPGTMNRTSLSDTSTPAATLYNENMEGTLFMGKPLEDITETADGLISFAAMRGAIPAPVVKSLSVNSQTSFAASWQPVEGATSYEISLSERLKDFETPEEGLLLKENFRKFYSKVNSSTDIGKKLDNYTTVKGWTGEKLYTSTQFLHIGKGEAEGWIKTPVIKAPHNGELTIEVTITPDQFAGNTTVQVHYGSKFYSSAFRLSSQGKRVIHASGIDEDFTVTVISTPAFISLLGVYDGTFDLKAPLQVDGQQDGSSDDEADDASDEDVAFQSVAFAGKAKAEAKKFTTTATSYTFNDLNSTSIYYLRVRAITPSGLSRWSDEQTIDMVTGTTPVLPVLNAPAGTYFDLQGRPVATPAHGLYIRDGKKVMVK